MFRVYGLVRGAVTATLAALLLGGLGAGVASAQSVQGNGVIKYSNGAKDGENLFAHINIKAWVDEDGFAQGKMSWIGDNPQPLPGGHGEFGKGPANPYILEVTGLWVDGNTAYVEAVAVSSPQGEVDGEYFYFTFTDNFAYDEPDEMDGVPLDTGNFVVTED
jgi:hypothetical protein